MQGSQSVIDTVPERLPRQSKYRALFIWVVSVCLAFGLYTLLFNALARDVAGEAHPLPRSLTAPDTPAVMKIDPAITYVDSGETFSITVMIQDVTDLGAFQFELTYNPTVVQTDTVELGPFLGSTGRSVSELGPTYGTGSVTYGAFSLPPPDNGPNGDGVLAILTFQATSEGTSTLHLQNVLATDTDGVAISTNTEDGEVTVGTAPAPTVTSITPNSGYTDQVLENVIVEGANFQAGAAVQLTKSGQSPIPASWVDVQNSTRISCTLNLKAAAGGAWDVVVTNPDTQSGTLTDGFTITSLPPPTVISITPNSGYNNGVVHITNLAGSNFQTGATVKLTQSGQPDINATNVVVVSDFQITCDFDLTGKATGAWDVVVTNPDTQSGTLTDGFTVNSPPPPTVISITPNSGYNNEVVHITNLAGSNFQTGATVKLTQSGQSDINATNVVVVSDSQITCDFDLTGAVSGTWDVVVTNPDSQSGTLLNGFTVTQSTLPPPTVTSITPNSGYSNEMVHITDLAGSDFQSGATVRLIKTGQADIVATNVVMVSASRITCDFDLRGASPGQWTVRVTNPDAQYAELANGFTVKTVVYLPLVMRRWPPVPDTPVLNAISNPDGDGNYTVSWNAAYLAQTYTLQEDDNASFSSPETQYTGPGTSWNASSKATGTYYYRVRASNSWGNSGWSTVQSVSVVPPPDHYTGSTPPVSFDVTHDQQVCNFDITVPFGSGSCRIWTRAGVCFAIVNHSFRIELYYEELGITDWIDGTFNSSRTSASGNYKVSICGNQLIFPASTGTWEASKQ